MRIGQIEDKQKDLTGQLEKIQFDLRQISDKLDRMQVDVDQRFQQAPPSHITTPLPSGTGGTLGTVSSGGAPVTAESLYETAFANIRGEKYEEAEKGFKEFLAQYPTHNLASNAQYWLGESYYVRGDYKQSARLFAQCYQGAPKGSKAEDSLLKLGLSLAKLDKKPDACLSLRQLQKEFGTDGNALQKRGTEEIKKLGCS
jgi:tol-pal system protein YbgF